MTPNDVQEPIHFVRYGSGKVFLDSEAMDKFALVQGQSITDKIMNAIVCWKIENLEKRVAGKGSQP